MCYYFWLITWRKNRGGFRGGAWGVPALPFFVITSFFVITLKNYELCQLRLNWSLIMQLWHAFTQILSDLIPNHLLFGRQLLCYSKTISTVVRTLIVFPGTHKINCINNHFLHRWGHDFVLNLCETQQTSKLNTNSQEIMLY